MFKKSQLKHIQFELVFIGLKFLMKCQNFNKISETEFHPIQSELKLPTLI